MEIIQSQEQFDEVLNKNSAVLIDFYADWCAPCKMLAPVLDKVSTKFDNVKFIKVNVDNLPEVASKYGVMSIPNLVAIKDGAVKNSKVGFMSETALQEFIGQIL